VSHNTGISIRLAFGNVDITRLVTFNFRFWNILLYPVPDKLANLAFVPAFGMNAEQKAK
jgi:hypothetical protein